MTATAMRAGLGERLAGAVTVLAGVLADLDPAVVHGDDARRLAEMFAEGRRVCDAGLALAAGRVAQTGSWKKGGERNATEWLARTARCSTGTARRTVETATRVARQPDLAESLRAGMLSAEQTEQIAAAIDTRPDATGMLIAQAAADPSLPALRTTCRAVRTVAGSEAAERAAHRRIHQRRYLRTWTDTDGAGRLDASMTADALARLESYLAPFVEETFAGARADGRRETYGAHSVDALLAMAAAAADRGHSADLGGDPGGGGDDPGGSQGRVRSGGVGPPATVIVRVDLAALRRGWTAEGETCQIDGVGDVPVALARSWAADAFMTAVLTDGVDIRSVVHLGRAVPPTSAPRSPSETPNA